jgi:hypothetical protein
MYWQKINNLVSFFFIHLFTCAYIVWVNSPPNPPTPVPTLFPHPPSLPGKTCSALISNFVEEKT